MNFTFEVIFPFILDDEEEAFERRKAKSMNQARARCLPMNFRCEDLVGVLKDRDRARELGAGSSLADVEPMTLDSKVGNILLHL